MTYYGKFATLIRDENDFCRKRGVPVGSRVKIVMESRFGDLGITPDLSKDFGYEVRVFPDWLDDISEKPAKEREHE